VSASKINMYISSVDFSGARLRLIIIIIINKFI
jgi:hypothetical protein